MALPGLDMLPMEVLQAISSILDDYHKPSVANFSLVNRQFRRAATPALFRKLSIQVEGPQRLADDIEQWTATLLANDSFRHVRELIVCGDIFANWKRRMHQKAADGRLSARYDHEESWLPLAHFIGRAKGLKDIYFRRSMHFPYCVLASLLKENMSSCRLHISEFSLSSLKRKPFDNLTGLLELSPADLSLVTSPNLYALVLSTGGSVPRTEDYNSGAIFELVAQACPALKEVEIIYRRIEATPRRDPTKAFPGLKLGQGAHRAIRTSNAKAELTTLSLRGREPQLEQWQHHTNFDLLRTLRLTGNMDAGNLDWAAKSALFPSLLCLEVQAPNGDGASTIKFLQSLPPLKDLSILGSMQRTVVGTISEKHGTTLQRLSLPDLSCSTDLVRELYKGCTALEHLAITLSRTEGDAHEVAIYTTLGSHPRIRSLYLNLDCSVDLGGEYDFVEPSYDANYHNVIYRHENIRRTLVNCALDSALVTDIFLRIAGAKPASAAALQSAKFTVIHAGRIISQGTPYNSQQRASIYQHFNRTWVCDFNVRDDRPDEPLVEDKGSHIVRKQHDALGDVEAAFHSIWPNGTSSDWWDNWKGLPLEG